MVELPEIQLELQLREAHRRIKVNRIKGCKFLQFLLPMFLQRFPAIMDNQISVNWDTITGVYDRTPFFPITLIDTEILDDWSAHPSIWEVMSNLQHSRHVLAMVCYTLPSSYKGQPAIVCGALFVLIPAHQVQTSLSDALLYLKCATKDCIVLVSTLTKHMFSPQPQRGKH